MSERPAHLQPATSVLIRLKELIAQKEPWVWVRQELKYEAEDVLMNLQAKGEILSFQFDGERATRGSACYKVEYSF